MGINKNFVVKNGIDVTDVSNFSNTVNFSKGVIVTGNNSSFSNTVSFSTVSVSANLTVGGNMIISGSTVYDANSFVLQSVTGSTATANSEYKVNRQTGTPTANNAALRWDNVGKKWQFNNVDTNVYYDILSKQDIDVSAYPVISPSLNLDFSNSEVIDSRISFSRNSVATRVRGDGLIELVSANTARIDFDPNTLLCKGLLVEESRTNLTTYSENFSETAWTKSNSYVASNVITAPDGSLTGDLCVPNNGLCSGGATVYKQISITQGLGYSISFFAKSNGGIFNTISPYHSLLNVEYVTFTLSGAGSYVIGGTGLYKSASITKVNNDWYYCTASCPSASSSGTAAFIFYLGGVTSPTGDGTSGIYIWGAQLEQGSFPTSYIPSLETFISRASTATYVGADGYIKTAAINYPRYSYNPANLTVAPKLLLEPAATNLLTYSEDFSNAAWSKSACSIVTNCALAPDGTNTADKFYEDNNNTVHAVFLNNRAATNETVTWSIFVKAAEITEIYFSLYSGSNDTASIINLLSGTFTLYTAANGSDYTNTSCSVIPYPNGWFRCSITTKKAAVTAYNSPFIYLRRNNSNAYQGDSSSGIYIWGAQLEQGSSATSYIPTTSGTVTRSADSYTSTSRTREADIASISGSNFYPWYKQEEGTIAVGFDHLSPQATNNQDRVYQISDSSTSSIDLYKAANTGIFTQKTSKISVTQSLANTSAASNNTLLQVVSGYKLNDIYQYSGNILSSNTTAIIPTNMNNLNLGSYYVNSANGTNQLNGHLYYFTYYPKRLSNTEIRTLSL